MGSDACYDNKDKNLNVKVYGMLGKSLKFQQNLESERRWALKGSQVVLKAFKLVSHIKRLEDKLTFSNSKEVVGYEVRNMYSIS